MFPRKQVMLTFHPVPSHCHYWQPQWTFPSDTMQNVGQLLWNNDILFTQCHGTAFEFQLEGPDTHWRLDTMAWFGAGTVGRVGCLCNAGPGWQLENSLNSLNSSHFFLNVRERIETTSAILPSTTNNYKGSTTSGVFFFAISAQYSCFKSLFCLPLFVPRIRQKFPGAFFGLEWPFAPLRLHVFVHPRHVGCLSLLPLSLHPARNRMHWHFLWASACPTHWTHVLPELIKLNKETCNFIQVFLI